MSTHPQASWLCIVCLFAATGCGAAGASSSDVTPRLATAADLSGEWHLTGSGKVYDCRSAADDGRLEPSFRAFRVDAELNDEETAGDASRVRSDYVSLTANISDDVEFKGGGDKEGALYFSIREMLSNDTELVYDFDGTVRDVDLADGTFTGSAPGDCKIKGDFSLRRK